MRDLAQYSVLMSVYAKEKSKYFKPSLDSVLNQTVKTDDFVIVCDGPLTKELDDLLEEYAEKNPCIKIKRLPENVGLGPALNEGIKICKHELVARMDSDDICFPDRFEKQLNIFHILDVDIVGGTVTEFAHNTDNVLSNRVLPENHQDIVKFSKKRNPFNHPSVMFKKSMVLMVDGYKDQPYFEDYYLWVRMLSAGAKGYNIQEPVMYMRSGSNMYKRRGGKAYIKHLVNFKRAIHSMGYTNLWEYIMSTVPHIIVSMVPLKMRKYIYKKVLRK